MKYKPLSEGLSVVIPAYNAEQWIQKTVNKIDNALVNAGLKKAEIIIVNDGSVDNTEKIAKTINASVPVKVISHVNEGRFLARKRGVDASSNDTILFIDTRVWLDEKAITYVIEQQDKYPDRTVWNGDVQVYKKGNIIARFGDAVTRIGWRKYHSNPRLLSYGIDEFDYYPKGTGIFIVPKPLLNDAISWFETQTKDIRNSSDDTLLIRYIVKNQRIWLSPGFTSIYFARTTIGQFLKHSYYRGVFFVDGFLRPGTRFFYPLILFLVLVVILFFAVVFFPLVIPYFLVLLSLIWICEFVIAILLKIGIKDALSLFILSPLFTIFYGAGIIRATAKRFIGA